MKSEDGYSSITVLILILFLSGITISVLLFLQITAKHTVNRNHFYAGKQLLEDEVYALIEEMGNDPTPNADSGFDPVWSYIKTRNNENMTLTLEDISSRFNLNFVRTKMLEHSSFKDIMIEGNTPQSLKLYRGEEGFFSDIQTGYSQFFTDEDLKKYFTVYSYANLNVTYEDSLKKLYSIRISEEGSVLFHESIQDLIRERIPADESKLKDILGADYSSLYPLININPLMNVNFIDEKILKTVLFYPYGEKTHKNSSIYFDITNNERMHSEVLPDRLTSILDVEDDYLRIFQYLGTVTWFWSIRAADKNLELNAVICRMPGSDEQDIIFQILEWQFRYLNKD